MSLTAEERRALQWLYAVAYLYAVAELVAPGAGARTVFSCGRAGCTICGADAPPEPEGGRESLPPSAAGADRSAAGA